MRDIPDGSGGGRFENEEGGARVFADYRRAGGALVIDHVEAAPELRGSGAAGRLMAAILALAEKEGTPIRPLCGYAAAWLARNDYSASRYRPSGSGQTRT